jgi:hypothetical protein
MDNFKITQKVNLVMICSPLLVFQLMTSHGRMTPASMLAARVDFMLRTGHEVNYCPDLDDTIHHCD